MSLEQSLVFDIYNQVLKYFLFTGVYTQYLEYV